MTKKILWHDNMTADEKIELYRAIRDILEQVGNPMDFNDFAIQTYFMAGKFFPGGNAEEFDFCAVVRELISRGYIRLELRDIEESGGKVIPIIDVVRIS